MKGYLVAIMIAVGTFLVSMNGHTGNPGHSAMSCLNVSTNTNESNNLLFQNRCSYKVFVVWCGDLKDSDKGCGEGINNTYYTETANINPFDEKSTSLNNIEAYEYAACIGSNGDNSEGIKHPAEDEGSYRCTVVES